MLERVLQTRICPIISSENISDEELIGLDWEVALSNESNDETLEM